MDKLRTMNFADIQEQGFIPLYTRDKLTDALHTVYGFETDYKFITKRQMKNIQKKVKAGNKILYSKTTQQIAEPRQNQEVQRFFCFVTVKDRILV